MPRKSGDRYVTSLVKKITEINFLYDISGATYEDTEAMTMDALSVAIKKPASFAAFDGDRLVGFHINRLHTPEDFPQMFSGKLCDPEAKFTYKNDYAEGESQVTEK